LNAKGRAAIKAAGYGPEYHQRAADEKAARMARVQKQGGTVVRHTGLESKSKAPYGRSRAADDRADARANRREDTGGRE
jgi:hypothetical protein